jgi:hypothetical protein
VYGDSQAMYAVLVRGDDGDGVYLRLPVAGGGRVARLVGARKISGCVIT